MKASSRASCACGTRLCVGVLLVFTLGCGGRSGLDVLGAPLASSEAGPPVNNSSCGSNGENRSHVGSDAPSCKPGGPGMTNCGANGADCCCTSLEVTGGTYYRTYTNSGNGPTAEADPATVSGFRLDKYLVTVGRFRQFANAWNNGSGYRPPAGSGKHAHTNGSMGLLNAGSDAGVAYETGWVPSDDGNVAPTNDNLACFYGIGPEWAGYATWTPSPGGQENLPINCVNWYEAYAFCIWDGGFLPSEAEWEYATAGGYQQRKYAWGSTDPGTNNQYAIYACLYPTGSDSCPRPTSPRPNPGVRNIAPVGTTTQGAGLWGQLDLAGNMSEWNLDWFDAYANPCIDCSNLTARSYRVLRGGDFEGDPSYLFPAHRADYTPTGRFNYDGFRCARTP